MNEHDEQDGYLSELDRDSDKDKGRLNDEHWPNLCYALDILKNEDLIEQLIESIESEGGFRLTEAPTENHRRLEQSATTGRWYAIQNSEIEFIKDAITWLAPLLDFKLTGGVATAAKVIAFGLNYLNKRIELTPLQAIVLQALCELPDKRGTIAEISARSGLSPDRVSGGLNSTLTLRNRRTNRLANLIEQDGDVWLALDL